MNKVTFAHCGNYHYPIKYLLKTLLKEEDKIVLPPKTTSKTIELGNKYSPDLICLPFKYNLGNFIESLENGANVIIHAGGGCKYGYYPEVQEQILRDLGYDFKFYNLISEHTLDLKKIYNIFKELNPKIKKRKLIHTSIYVFLMTIYMDKIDNYRRLHEAKLKNKNEFNIIYNNMINDFMNKKSLIKLFISYLKHKKKFKKAVKIKNQNLKIGIIGELYTNMNSSANNDLEKKLINNGNIVKRFTNASYLLFFKNIYQPFLLRKIKKYAKYNLGADAHDNISRLIWLKKHSYDGVIHIKPFGCTPEIGVIPILEKVSNDLNIPIMFLTEDVNNGEEGFNTRIEAFEDMLKMRKDKNND